ncbi:MAG: hypothetical protein E7Z75_10165 [Methanobrevibacter olleyae]|uniref:Uncharacterized protein n=1 Tax=Methanobrevibacter olleyae TaxID=294671 RepID=A0A8T3VZN1_METOL|nr:hypothetical protein [Methanobrevibacter olleyae]
MIKELLNLIKEYDVIGNQLNLVKSELRIKEFELKTRKLQLEFDSEFIEGLKVKEIPSKVHEATLKEAREICDLKAKRDKLEHKFKMTKLQIDYIKNVIESKQ